MISEELRSLAVELAALPGKKTEDVLEIVGLVRRNLLNQAERVRALEEHLRVEHLAPEAPAGEAL